MKNNIDYNKLDNTLNKNFYKLEDVKHRLIKICFDIVRFKDADPDELWQIQNSDDGDYIVARYETPEETNDLPTKTASKNDWEISVDASQHLHIFYKNYQVAKLKAATLGLENTNLDTVKRFLPTKLASDTSVVNSLLDTLSTTERFQLLRTFPELQRS